MEVSAIDRVLGRRAGVLRLVLELVFGLLPPCDMKNAVLVCQMWRELGEAPRFWAKLWRKHGRDGVIKVTRENLSTMPERLDSRRMRDVRELWMMGNHDEVSEEVLHAVARHPGLRSMSMNYMNDPARKIAKPA